MWLICNVFPGLSKRDDGEMTDRCNRNEKNYFCRNKYFSLTYYHSMDHFLQPDNILILNLPLISLPPVTVLHFRVKQQSG